MKQLVSKGRYYFKLYYCLVRANVMEILIFRANALVMGLGPIVWMAGMVIMAATIFSKVSNLGGWNFWEVIFLTGVHELIFILSWSIFLINLRTFIDDVRSGLLDQFLLKPISARFLVSFRGLDFTNIGSFLNVIFIFFFSFSKIMNETFFTRLPGFILFLFIAYGICYLVYFIFACLVFYMLNSRTFLDIIFEMTDFDRYPAGIYPNFLRTFLTFVLPILFFAYYPTAFLLGKIGNQYLYLGLFLLVILWLISNFIWRKGLKRYQSASS